MADRSPRRSRRLRGLSPPSLEPSPRRRRGDITGGVRPTPVDASGIDPPLGDISGQARPGTSEQERDTPILSRVRFQTENDVEVEELSESLVIPNSPLPSSYPDVLQYVGTPSNRPASPGYAQHLPFIVTTGSMASTSAATMQTPISVQGGGTISIPSASLFGSFASTSLVGSTSIPSTSGNAQTNAFSTGSFLFGTQSQGIPSVPFSAATSMMGGSASFQGFPFGSGHIPHSNPTVGSMPFSSIGQSSNPFQGWNNLGASSAGTANPFIGQQGGRPYSTVSMFQSVPPLASAWNPYQGLSTPYHSLGGNFAGYGGYTAGVGQTPNFAGPQGLPVGSAGSIGHWGQPGASQIPGQSFQNFGSSAQSGWNPLGPPRLPFLATLNLPDLTKLTNDPIRYNPVWPPVPTKLPSDIPKFEGKSGEDPGDHVTTFHLWCSSNSLIEDSIRLRLF